MSVIERDNVIYRYARTRRRTRILEVFIDIVLFFFPPIQSLVLRRQTNSNRFWLRGCAPECLESGKMFKHCNMFHFYWTRYCFFGLSRMMYTYIILHTNTCSPYYTHCSRLTFDWKLSVARCEQFSLMWFFGRECMNAMMYTLWSSIVSCDPSPQTLDNIINK